MSADDEPIELYDWRPELLVRLPLEELVAMLRLCPPAADVLAVWLLERLHIQRELGRPFPEFTLHGQVLPRPWISRATTALLIARRWRSRDVPPPRKVRWWA